MSGQNHVSLTRRYLQAKVCEAPKYASPLYCVAKLATDAMLHNIAPISVPRSRVCGIIHFESLFLTDSCDKMAGVVCVCVCVCFALKVQLKCVGFPAL